MTPFAYRRAADSAAAIRLAEEGQGRYLGGGTNLVDLMRENIERAAALVDVSGLSRSIQERDGGLLIGGGVTNTDLASHPAVRRNFPMLAQAIFSGASGQIRNMATVGGNLLQRTRCLYFYDGAARCNKREAGAGCDAIGGHNRMHAIFGASDKCVATHPSDMCVALAALGAFVHLDGPQGERKIHFLDLHRLPGETPERETNLRPGELVTGVELPSLPVARRSIYRKVRERASYAFALVSVAAAIEVAEGNITQARLALGGVAHKPWRALAAEEILVGAPIERASFERAAARALEGARPLAHNGFKIDLAARVIVAALSELAAKEIRP